MKGFAIQLGFSGTEKRRLLDVFEKIDSPVLKLGGLPHLSLAVYQKNEEEELADLTNWAGQEIEPFMIHICGVDSFEGPNAVGFLRVELTDQLRTFHRKLSQESEKRNIIADRYYKPDSWTPHITLTIEDEGKKKYCLSEIPKFDIFGEYRVTSLSLIEFRPVRRLLEIELNQNKALWDNGATAPRQS